VEALTPPLLIAAALLVVAGVPKVLRPAATARALAGVGLPGRSSLVRLLGAAEVAIGTAAIAAGGPLPALAVGTAYLGFAAFVAIAMGRGGASCGCLGGDETPPTAVHLVLDATAAAVALLAATASPVSLPALLGSQPAGGLPMLGLMTLGTWFAYLALSLLPRLAPEARA
jgi:hypothetical protein